VVSGKHCNLVSCIYAHDYSAVTYIYHVGCVIYDHNNGRARARPFGTDLLAGVLMLGALLGLLDKLDETFFTFFEPLLYGFLRVHRELLILNHKIVQVIPKVISTGSATVTIENPKKAYLRPFNFKLGLWFRFENIQDYANAIFVVLSDDTLIGVCSIGLDDTAFLLASFGWLMVF